MGQTLQSKFKISLNGTSESTCSLRRDSIGKFIQQPDLLVINEISMEHKHIFGCLARSLHGVRQFDKGFAGFPVLLSGAWKQLLPVVRNGVR